MSENTPEAEVVDAELMALLTPTAQVPDDEHMSTGSAPTSEADAALIAALRDSWEKRQTKDDKELGTRVRVPRVFNGSGDLQTWQRKQAGEIQRTAYELGFSTKNSGRGLGWQAAIAGNGEQIRIKGCAVYFLYLRTITRSITAKSSVPVVQSSVPAVQSSVPVVQPASV